MGSVYEGPLYCKIYLKRPLKTKNKTDFQLVSDYRLIEVKSIAEYSKGKNSVILSTFIKLPFSIKIFV